MNECDNSPPNHYESEYISRIFKEPLRDALSAIVLYKPPDPIFFLAHYLRYWADRVRDYRRRKAAMAEMERLMEQQVRWSICVLAEQAIRLEQDYLAVERLRVEESARLAKLERERIRKKKNEIANTAGIKLRNNASSYVLEEMIEMAVNVIYKRWQVAETARRRAEAAAAEAAEEAMMEEGE